MADEIEVSTEETKNETPVSFVESDGATLVTVGEDEKKGGESPPDDERLRRAEANQARLAQAFDEFRSRAAGGPSAPQASHSPAPDPWKAQEDAIAEEERALGIQWEAHKAAGTFRNKPELVTEFDGKARALQQRRIDIATQRAVQTAMPAFIQASQQQRYRSQYSDVVNHPQASRYARGHFEMLLAKGHPDSEATVEMATNEARRAFNLAGARYQPTDRDREQLTGFSGTRRTNMEPKNNTVKMGKSEKVIAMAMYGNAFNGDEKKVYSQWAKGPGIRAQKAMQKARSAARNA